MKELTKLKDGVYWNGNAVIYPIKKNPQEPFRKGNIDWMNFIIGNRGVLIFMLFILFLAFAYSHDTKACRELMAHPCEVCDSMRSAAVLDCAEEYQKMGLCYNLNGIEDINLSLMGVNID